MIDTAVIADDLTGACDAGVKLKIPGCSTRVIADAKECGNLKQEDIFAVSVNTDTRSVPEGESRRTLIDVTSALRHLKVGHYYKKVDSVLRGNVGSEIETCLEQMGLEFALIAPAFPETGRTIQNGILRIRNKDGTGTVVNAADAICATSHGRCAIISEHVVRSGAAAIRAEIEGFRKEGFRLILADAAEEDDFSSITEAASHFGPRFLPVGSAGWIPYLRKIWSRGTDYSRFMHAGGGVRGVEGRHVVVAVGSRHPVSISQIGRLKLRNDVSCYTIRTSALTDEQIRAHAQALLDRFREDCRQGRVKQGVVVTTDLIYGGDAPVTEEVISQDLTNRAIVEAIAETVEMSLELLPVGALIVAGGDVASGVLRRLSSRQIELIEEPFPGIVTGSVELGTGNRLLIATKSGGFGDERTLDRLYGYVRSVRYDNADPIL